MELRLPMQPTVRPWPWPGGVSWDQRLSRGSVSHDLAYQRHRFRLTLQDLAHLSLHDSRGFSVDWPDPRQEIAVYVPKNLRHLIRIDSSNPVHSTGLGFQPSWSPTTPPSRNSVKGFGWFAGEDWKIPDLKNLRLEPIPLTPSMRLERGRGWDAARAWAGGALALLALVLLVRAVEKCIHRNFFKTRRRQSEEWPTPNVLATSHRPANDLDLPSSPRMDDSDVFHSEGNQDTISNDLPPPYSECANGEPSSANKYIGPEEPPPPYSDCYVAYANPKDGVPSVHFLNRRRENIIQNRLVAGQSSSMPDVNIQNADNTAQDCDGCDSKTEFVFENGRIVQRDIDVSNDNTQSNDEFVVNISETGSEDVPERLSVQV